MARSVVGSVGGAVRRGGARAAENPRSTASTGFVAVAAVTVLVAMFLADGFRASTYDLKDSGVWVVNGKTQKFGRINTQIAEQDGVHHVQSRPVDVVQDGADVFVQSGTTWSRVDPMNVVPAPTTLALPEDPMVDLAGGTFAVMDSDGRVWTSGAQDVEQLNISPDATGAASDDGESAEDAPRDPSGEGEGSAAEGAEPVIEAGAGARMAVGRNGDVVVASPELGQIVVIPSDGGEHRVHSVDLESSGEGLQVSMVGAEPVVLDAGKLLLPDAVVDVPAGSDARLQLPGDEPDEVLVATGEGLLAYPIDGGEPERIGDATGPTPGMARPVQVGGCTYAAWQGPSASVLHRCGADIRTYLLSETSTGEVALPEGADLEFRVNRTHVALNELTEGLVLVVIDGDLVQANQWDDPDDPDQDDEQQQSPDKVRQLDFDTKENQPPVARDDNVGARPGLPTIVKVLENDSDANSDILTIVNVPEVIDGGLVELIQGGQALQVTPTSDRGFSFTYRAFDGLAESNEATVKVAVYDASVQNPPKLRDGPMPPLTVGAGAVGTYDVLQHWDDPEGDPIVLESAKIDDSAGAIVSSQSEGLVTYVDELGEPADNTVEVVVSDAPLLAGVAPAPAPGDLRVKVTSDAVNSPPVARNDFATTVEEQPVVLWPMRNDSDPDGDELRFELRPEGDIPYVTDNRDGSVTITPPPHDGPGAPSPILFGYELSDGHATHQARIRVDVLSKDATQAPSAAMDLLILPAPPESGRAAEGTVDLLANDFSPRGAVLVVNRIDIGELGEQGLQVQLIEHRRLRVAYAGRLDEPATLTYQVSDGVNTATGTVVIVSSKSDENLPPLAIDDVVTVRTGDIVSIPVLANDIDPEGAPLVLRSELAQPPPPGQGLAFVSGQRVRYVAPDRPTDVNLTYEVSDDVDPARRGSTGRIRISVRDSDTNRAPVPLPVEARVLSGSRVKITVPLTGVDPDGDSVRLLGLGTAGQQPHAPSLGRIVEVGLDYLVYEAFEDQQGTDEFRYRVVDTGGTTGTPLEGQGVVRVGVAASTDNQPPTAVSDTFVVRPGSSVVVDPLANDFDPDGDSINLAADGPLSGASPGLTATAEGDKVRLGVPRGESSHSVGYRIEDPFGLTADAVIHVKVDPRAPGVPPIARDDLAEVGASQKSVTVAVLDNDDDPDGDRAKLRVRAVDGFAGAPSADARKLVVPVGPRAQVVPYELVDEQGLTAMAVVRVPPAGEGVDLPPMLRKDADELVILDGEPITIDLAGHVVDPEGHAVRFASSGLVSPRGRAEVTSPTTMTFSEPTVDRGVAPVTFVVTDAPEGAEGNSVALTVLVAVESTKDRAPTWKRTSEVLVSIDESEVFELDLAKLVEDPEGADLRFAKVAQPAAGAEVSVTPEGKLTVASDGSLKIDQVGRRLDPAIEVSVSDGANDGVIGKFPVRIRTTGKPPPTVRTFRVDAEAGKPQTVNVLDGSFNPFGESAPLQIVRGSLRYEDGHGDGGFNGSELNFKPASNFVGTTVVTYRVQDRVGRQVPGMVTFTVRAKPGRPGQPSVSQLSASSVEVRWTAAAPNGSPIERYTLSSPAVADKDCGTELSCVVTGLRPGNTYAFTVTATNALGDGPPSSVSRPITPDECPGPPKNLRLSFVKTKNPAAGGQLIATWDEPDNEGTTVNGYELTVHGSNVEVSSLGPRETHVEIGGLTNGTPHTVEVRARNSCDKGLGLPAESNEETPAGRPDAPTTVTADRVDGPAGGQIRLTWTAPTLGGVPNSNGAEVEGYTVTEVSGRRKPEPLDATSLQVSGRTVTAVLSVDRDREYSFTVTAENKAGVGAASSATRAVTAEGRPDAVTNLQVRDHELNSTQGLDGRVVLSFTDPSETGGVSISRREYRRNGGAWTMLPASGSGEYSVPASNGVEHSFEVRVCNHGQCGEQSNTIRARPYGPLPPPLITASPNGNQVTFRWSPNGSTKGTTIQTSTLTESATGSRPGASGSVIVDGAYSTDYWVTVTYTDDRGQTSSHRARGRTENPPPPPPPPLPAWQNKLSSRGEMRSHRNVDTSGGYVIVPPLTPVTIQCKTPVPPGVADSAGPYWYRITAPAIYAGYASSDAFWLGRDSSGNLIDQPDGGGSYDGRVPNC